MPDSPRTPGAAWGAPVPAPEPAPAISWRHRALRRTAGSVGVAVVLAGVAPAIANAAGASVANPVAIALRASGDTLQEAFGATDEEAAAPCVTPSVEPTAVDPGSADPDAPVSSEPDDGTSAEPSAEPTAEPTDGAGTDGTGTDAEPTAEPSAEPTAEPSAEPTAEPSEEPADDADDCAEPEATLEPTESAAPSETPEPADEEAGSEHGQIVSTVAKCAPKGKDRLLDVEGAPGNHGGYVKVAAHGGTLTTPWGSYDLSTQAGADELCASFAAARDALPAETASADKGHGKKKDKAGRPAKEKKVKDAAHGKAGKGGKAKR